MRSRGSRHSVTQLRRVQLSVHVRAYTRPSPPGDTHVRTFTLTGTYVRALWSLFRTSLGLCEHCALEKKRAKAFSPFPFPSKRPPLALQTRSSTPPPLSSDRSRFFCSNARARSRARAEVDDGMAGEQEAALGTPPGPSPGWPSTRSADVDAPPPAAARTPSGTSQPTTSPGRHFAERSARGAQERPLLHLRTVRTVPVVETTQEHVSPTYVPNVTLHLRTYVRTHVTFPYVRTRTCI